VLWRQRGLVVECWPRSSKLLCRTQLVLEGWPGKPLRSVTSHRHWLLIEPAVRLMSVVCLLNWVQLLNTKHCSIINEISFHAVGLVFLCESLLLCHLAFSALTLLVGNQEEHPACKNWVIICWHGSCVSRMRSEWFAFSWADVTATALSSASLKSSILSSAYPGCPGKEAIKRVLVWYVQCHIMCEFSTDTWY